MLVCVKLLKLLKSSFHLLNCWGQPPHKEDLKKLGLSGESDLAVGTDKAVGDAHSLDQLMKTG